MVSGSLGEVRQDSDWSGADLRTLALEQNRNNLESSVRPRLEELNSMCAAMRVARGDFSKGWEGKGTT